MPICKATKPSRFQDTSVLVSTTFESKTIELGVVVHIKKF